ncbi:putative bifunctional diguanylate cyclase/phosphodiesterase [Sphingomonas endolithica]|uniref:putative bifunctional diguanylate cyclase/phosphodiesterase n=1 Tax=Sphingomonas endolithica TaxID=2972485 RepID=UPI0021AF29BC|nr:EAL domain-containing protein [Sphingomonas sp. ZFBP2030]
MTLDGDDLTLSPGTGRGTLLNDAITFAAILLFVGIASVVLSLSLQAYSGNGERVNHTLVVALLLNVALILFGWRRHRDLSQQVTVRTAAEERAHSLASKDPLTGFLNRRSLAEEGAAMFVRAEKRRKAMALIMLDLDHFKTVNDMHGHATGDALLKLVAADIADAMPAIALTARLGGDEFACAFLFDAEHPDTVERVAERLVSRLARPLHVNGLQLHISATIGIARSDFDCSSIDALMRAADIAMYAAKNAGRNRYAWFDRSMERDLQARSDLESGLRLAIPRCEIVPYFEQQVDLATGRLTGFEVLARWEHPTRGLIGPDTFIPIAEQTGMIAEMSLSIMRQAFLAAKDWDARLSVSVNISPWQLKDAWLSQKIIKVLTETGFPASRLEIEITESSLFDNLALAQSIVGSLKNQGIAIALDDFGTGYSSLAHLRALPFDRIKIDKSFIMSIAENAESAAIVNAITRLGESLNLPITAEGIEDARIEERLRALGCAKGQGYLYGQPLSAINVRRLLAEKRLLRVVPSERASATVARAVG